MKRVLALLPVLAICALLAACGNSESDRGSRPVSLTLDFTPNAVHSGIYLAHQRGFDEAEGVPLQIHEPSSGTDAVKLLLSGRSDFAIMDIHDLALAREKGKDLVGVMALVQTPLAAVIAKPGTKSPKDLAGGTAGVTGLPSDVAVLNSVIKGSGGDPTSVKQVTIGFTAVPSLLAGKVDAVTAFWNVEGVALKAKKPGIKEFRVDDYGAPSYPELVLVTSRTTLQDSPDEVNATIKVLRRGYQEAINDPESAEQALLKADPALRESTVKAEFDAVSPSFTAGAKSYGELNEARLQAWSKWEQKFGITKKRPDVNQTFRTTN
jgi:ABC-type nitrate/sulfonate/bicarbonate transport system substrate-binding protein